MITRPDNRSIKRLIVSTTWHWDFQTALLTALIFGGVVLTVDDFRGHQPILITGATASLGVTGFVWTIGKSVSDWMHEGPYGELVRLVDPSEEAATLPYQIIAAVALVAGVVCLGTAVSFDALPTIALALLHTTALFLWLWTIFGIWSLVRLTFLHRRRVARIRAIEEAVNFANRQQQTDAGGQQTERPDQGHSYHTYRPNPTTG